MAYNYFPTGYQPFYQAQPQIQPQPQLQPQNGILWVQGLEGAKAHPINPSSSVLLMDSEESQFFIKTADASGMPSLRVFEYSEKNAQPKQDMSEYITREEFNARIDEIMKEKKHAKSDLHDAKSK